MGRAKVNMELIKKEKTRRITYKKRKEGLLRKMHEFTTLCGVNACLIIYSSPDDNDNESEDVWPKNNEDQVKRLINLYKSKGMNSTGGNKTYGLHDYFDDRNKKMEDELQKMRQKIGETRYPTWFEFMSDFSEMQLREFGNSLEERIQFVKNRLDLMKGKNFIELGQTFIVQQNSQIYQHEQHQQFPGMFQKRIELELTNRHLNMKEEAIPPPPAPETAQFHFIQCPSACTVEQHQHQHQIQSINNQNSMMMLLLSGNVSDNAIQFNGEKSSYNFCYEQNSSAVENVIYNNPRPITSYCYPTLPHSYMRKLFEEDVSSELLTLRENLNRQDAHHAQMTMNPWF